MGKILTAYFSASGITANIAKELSNVVGGDIYQIRPEVAYSNDDLNWMDKNSRSSVEMNNKNYRPPLADRNANIENYDIILLGFPIWWYVAPTIINTFLESYDFKGKKIVIFATSGGSGFGKTMDGLKGSLAKDAEVIEGYLIRNSDDIYKMKRLIESL